MYFNQKPNVKENFRSVSVTYQHLINFKLYVTVRGMVTSKVHDAHAVIHV